MLRSLRAVSSTRNPHGSIFHLCSGLQFLSTPIYSSDNPILFVSLKLCQNLCYSDGIFFCFHHHHRFTLYAHFFTVLSMGHWGGGKAKAHALFTMFQNCFLKCLALHMAMFHSKMNPLFSKNSSQAILITDVDAVSGKSKASKYEFCSYQENKTQTLEPLSHQRVWSQTGQWPAPVKIIVKTNKLSFFWVFYIKSDDQKAIYFNYFSFPPCRNAFFVLWFMMLPFSRVNRYFLL